LAFCGAERSVVPNAELLGLQFRHGLPVLRPCLGFYRPAGRCRRSPDCGTVAPRGRFVHWRAGVESREGHQTQHTSACLRIHKGFHVS
jgi:hypothetical protein